MATWATAVNRWFTKSVEGTRQAVSPEDKSTRVRNFANEDIYFYVKRIDNTSVVRVMDPEAGHVCWKVIGSVVAAALLLICVLMPHAYGVLAGYRVEALKKQVAELQSDQAKLIVEEATLLSPARMEELAESQKFVDPEPANVIYLDKDSDGEMARARNAAAGEKH